MIHLYIYKMWRRSQLRLALDDDDDGCDGCDGGGGGVGGSGEEGEGGARGKKENLATFFI